MNFNRMKDSISSKMNMNRAKGIPSTDMTIDRAEDVTGTNMDIGSVEDAISSTMNMGLANDVMGTNVNRAKDAMGTNVNRAKDVVGTNVNRAKDFVGTNVNRAKDVVGTNVNRAKDVMGTNMNRAKDIAGASLGIDRAKDTLGNLKNTATADLTGRIPDWKKMAPDLNPLDENIAGLPKPFLRLTASGKRKSLTEAMTAASLVAAPKELARKKLGACRSTLMADLKRFIAESKLHGCAQLASPSRGGVSRFLWGVALAIMLCFLIYSQVTLLIEVSKYPIKTVGMAEVKSSLPFPGLTLCNINDVDSDKVPFNATLFRNFKADLVWNQLLNLTLDLDVLNMLSTPISSVLNCSWIDFQDFFALCKINGEALNCSDIFTFVQTSTTRCAVLDTNHPDLRAMTYAGLMSGLQMYLNVHQDGYVSSTMSTAGVKLYVHEPGHLADFQSSGLLLSPGLSSYVGITPVRYKFLPAPYKAYGEEYCVDTTGTASTGKLRLADSYSYKACNLQCSVDHVASVCGCNGVQNDLVTSVLPVCTLQEFYQCYEKGLSQMYYNISADNTCGCERPCEFMSYKTQMSTGAFPAVIAEDLLNQLGLSNQSAQFRENYLEVRVYLDEIMEETIQQEAMYTFNSVIGNIGGQMSVFLGASILSVVELTELFLVLLLGCLRRNTPGRNDVTDIIPVEPKSPSV